MKTTEQLLSDRLEIFTRIEEARQNMVLGKMYGDNNYWHQSRRQFLLWQVEQVKIENELETRIH